MWMAWYIAPDGVEVQISPSPRRSAKLLEQDVRVFEMQHPGKRAEVRECKKKEDGSNER